MNSHATLVIVRPDPSREGRNHPGDTRIAQEAVKRPPCWVVLIGKGRTKRHDEMAKALGLSKFTERGINVYAPVEVCDDDWTSAQERDLPNALAQYLAKLGYRAPLRGSALEVLLPESFPMPLMAAVVEAAAVYPYVDIHLGETVLKSSLRWEHRRDRFLAPPPGALDAELIGRTPSLQLVRDQVAKYAGHPFPVLVLGETGTGKEEVAKMLHQQSARSGKLMTQNAAQLPAQLADSLLFGHIKGAFTGAEVNRRGRIREAHEGTFFLDEVFNLEPAVQGKLLRALNRAEEGVILVESLGSTDPAEEVHTRLVVAAQDDPRLAPTVSGGSSMRTDLYYRVAAGLIRLPPLRECLDDLPALVERFAKDVTVESSGIDALREHSWPGNVRELRLVLLRAVMDGPPKATTLSADTLRSALRSAALPNGGTALMLPCHLAAELKRIEVETMRAALRAANGVKAEAGRKIGMDDKNARNFGSRLETAERQLRELDGPDAQ